MYFFPINTPTGNVQSSIRESRTNLGERFVSDGLYIRKDEVIQKIDIKIDSLSDEDAAGHIYWMEFKEFIKNL